MAEPATVVGLANMSMGAGIATATTMIGLIAGVISLLKIRWDYKIAMLQAQSGGSIVQIGTSTSPPLPAGPSTIAHDDTLTYKRAIDEFVRKESLTLIREKIDGTFESFEKTLDGMKEEQSRFRDVQNDMVTKVNEVVTALGSLGAPIGKRKSDLIS